MEKSDSRINKENEAKITDRKKFRPILIITVLTALMASFVLHKKSTRGLQKDDKITVTHKSPKICHRIWGTENPNEKINIVFIPDGNISFKQFKDAIEHFFAPTSEVPNFRNTAPFSTNLTRFNFYYIWKDDDYQCTAGIFDCEIKMRKLSELCPIETGYDGIVIVNPPGADLVGSQGGNKNPACKTRESKPRALWRLSDGQAYETNTCPGMAQVHIAVGARKAWVHEFGHLVAGLPHPKRNTIMAYPPFFGDSFDKTEIREIGEQIAEATNSTVEKCIPPEESLYDSYGEAALDFERRNKLPPGFAEWMIKNRRFYEHAFNRARRSKKVVVTVYYENTISYNPPWKNEAEHMKALKKLAELQFPGWHFRFVFQGKKADVTVYLGHKGTSVADGNILKLNYETIFSHEFAHTLDLPHHYIDEEDKGQCTFCPPGEGKCIMDRTPPQWGAAERFALGLPMDLDNSELINHTTEDIINRYPY